MNKLRITDLAVCGGSPAFKEKLHVGRHNIGNRKALMHRIDELLDRRWLTNNGPFVREFENKITQLTRTKHCIVMCNATTALEIAIRALELKGEVIIPSFTFVATAHALQWQEITPVFCDIDPLTHTLDPQRVEELITPRTTGIIGVHLWGRACKVDELSEIARRRNLKLLFDAAHAFGCSHQGKMIGNFGDAEVFSFHATKFFNAFEGGAVLTNDDELAKKIRLMKNFGFVDYDEVTYIGTNGKMSEISAAMGLTGLESLDEFISINRHNYIHYRNELNNIPGIKMVEYNEKEKCNFQYIVLEIDERITGIARDEILQILQAEHILARRYFYPGCHRMEPYRSYFPHAHLLLPKTEELAKKVLSLPTGTGVSTQDIIAICQIIRFSIEHSQEIRQSVFHKAFDSIISNNQ
jgi:dTDP-4-amino-4,6-dideoxygalactose transaminase